MEFSSDVLSADDRKFMLCTTYCRARFTAIHCRFNGAPFAKNERFYICHCAVVFQSQSIYFISLAGNGVYILCSQTHTPLGLQFFIQQNPFIYS